MSNHPNRSKKNPSESRNPDPEEIKAKRAESGLSARLAGFLVHANFRTWQQWEAGERRMHPAFWELFTIKLAMLNAGTLKLPPDTDK
jgi:DNA-binding transcriptional regulator YiaG